MRFEPILGIIGNVGPEADELLQGLIRLRSIREGATRDQDFLPMIVVKNPGITDRTSAIFEGGPSPVEGILDSCSVLERAGCFLAALPSNTSHHFREEYQARTPVHVVDIIACTLRVLHGCGRNRVGLLGTTPTIRTGVFQRHAEAGGTTFVAPGDDDQEMLVQSAIYGSRDEGQSHAERRNDGIKAGRYDVAIEKLLRAVDSLALYGVDTFVCGCTEISIVRDELRGRRGSLRFVDPMECLADECFELAMMIRRAGVSGHATPAGRTLDAGYPSTREEVALHVSAKMRAAAGGA